MMATASCGLAMMYSRSSVFATPTIKGPRMSLSTPVTSSFPFNTSSVSLYSHPPRGRRTSNTTGISCFILLKLIAYPQFHKVVVLVIIKKRIVVALYMLIRKAHLEPVSEIVTNLGP